MRELLSALMEVLHQVMDNPKVALSFASALTSTGVLSYINVINGLLSMVSMTVGIIIALVVLRNHLAKGRVIDLEIKRLRKQL